jgi:hypothetical protein
MSTSVPASSGIFISYRRTDSAYPAGWLFDRLAEHFGRTQVFKDVDSLQPGDDFVEVITAAVVSCAALVAVIGERWLSAADEHGRRRLDNPDDFVRVEIEAALTRGVRVIPVLVDGASMPRSADLPPSLQPLARRHAIELNPYRFDTSALVRVLDATISGTPATPAPEGDAVKVPVPRHAGRHQQKSDSSTAVQAAALPGEILEAAIQRLESSGSSRNVREAADGLLAMGYELRLAKTTVPGKTPENYLRIMDPSYTAHGIGYLTPTMFSFSRALDRERLSGLPGAALVSNAVNFSHVGSAQSGLTAARLLRGQRQDLSVNKVASIPSEASSTGTPEKTDQGEAYKSFGDVQVTADEIEEAIAWCLNTTGEHSSFTSAMKSRGNTLAVWAEQGYPGLKTWGGKQPPPKPQITAYLRQAIAKIRS